MELPQKIKQPKERMMNGTLVATHLSPTEVKINEVLDYLESQKEGKTKCEHNYLLRKDLKTACVDCGEEPKQIDVDVMLFEYTTLHAQPDWTRKDYQRMQEIINTFKQALQQ